MILNFDTSGNTGIRYQEYEATGTTVEKWSVWFMTTNQFDRSLKSTQRDRISEMGILRGGIPTNEDVVNAIAGLVEKSRLEENRDLGIKIARIQAEEGWKELLLETLADRFQMEPVDESRLSIENKK